MSNRPLTYWRSQRIGIRVRCIYSTSVTTAYFYANSYFSEYNSEYNSEYKNERLVENFCTQRVS